MERLKDYYRILQVHHLAEPEVIEGAYKRLAKKYHPDINRDGNSEEVMKWINRAFEVLSDPVERQKYDLIWKDKLKKQENNHRKDDCERAGKVFTAAKSILDEYFRNIMDSSFDFSYELISGIDRANISREEFIDWQRAVSMVFHLMEYNCGVHGIYRNKILIGHLFEEIVEFSVSTVEYNTVMDMVEKNTYAKVTVLEDGKWRVLIGYEKLQPMIGKFEALTGLLTAKSVINELMETHSRVDSPTGLANQRGFIERLQNEAHRFDRYGRPFSLIMCDIDINKKTGKNNRQAVKEYIMKSIGEILVKNLRKLDVVGRWGENTFIILLPETRLSAALSVTGKIGRILKDKKLVYDRRTYGVSARFGTVEYGSSVEETLDRVNTLVNSYK